MKTRSNLPRSASRAISWMTDRSMLLVAAPSYRHPAEWLPVPRTNTPRCISRRAAHIGVAPCLEIRHSTRIIGGPGLRIASAALVSMEAVVDVAGRGVATTNPNEVFPPQAGRTKLDLANYYAVAQGALP